MDRHATGAERMRVAGELTQHPVPFVSPPCAYQPRRSEGPAIPLWYLLALRVFPRHAGYRGCKLALGSVFTFFLDLPGHRPVGMHSQVLDTD